MHEEVHRIGICESRTLGYRALFHRVKIKLSRKYRVWASPGDFQYTLLDPSEFASKYRVVQEYKVGEHIVTDPTPEQPAKSRHYCCGYCGDVRRTAREETSSLCENCGHVVHIRAAGEDQLQTLEKEIGRQLPPPPDAPPKRKTSTWCFSCDAFVDSATDEAERRTYCPQCLSYTCSRRPGHPSYQTHLESVRTMMVAFGQSVPPLPTFPPTDVLKLRAALVLEEALEFVAACGYMPIGSPTRPTLVPAGEPDMLEIIDALCDLDIVGPAGTSVALGIDLEPFLSEVDNNNFAKVKNGHRDPSGKWIKPADHPAPDLLRILLAQGGIQWQTQEPKPKDVTALSPATLDQE